MARKTVRTIPQQRAFMPVQDPAVRAHNFDEVTQGFSLEDAHIECERCLVCPQAACIAGSWKSGMTYSATGRRIEKTAPPPSALPAVISPPCRCAISRAR